MELREVQSLIRLAANGSILETAKASNLSPGAIHKHLKSLELEFGVTLYSKQDGRLRLTSAGQLILPYLREIFAQKEAAVQALADWKTRPTGLIRIGAGPAFSSHILPSILDEFGKQHKDVQFYVETGSGDHLLDRLAGGALDLAFDLSMAPTEARLVEVASWTAPMGFVSGISDTPSSCELRDLESLPFVLFGSGSRVDKVIQGYFDANSFQPAVVMRSDSAEAIKAMVQNGLGIAMIFLWSTQDELRTGSLRQISVVDKPPATARMSLLIEKTPYVPKAIGAFIDAVRGRRWNYLVPVD